MTILLLSVSAALAGEAATSQPASNLDYWLSQAQAPASRPAESHPAGAAASESKSEPAETSESEETTTSAPTGEMPGDAVPGVVELSDGRLIPGMIFTTTEQPWSIYIADQKRWRLVPMACVLGVQAVVVEEKMEPRWRWKAMGEPERVYTGQEYPTRRFLWKFRLIDGTELTGTVKGHPLWVEADGNRTGPLTLHERSQGADGQSLKDLVYVRRIVVSRRAMEAVASQPTTSPAVAPASPIK